MKQKAIRYVIASVTIIALSLGLTACAGEPKDGQYAELAKCLTEKGVKMYGTYWCGFCNKQKKIFGDDFRYVSFVECDPKGENGDRQACLDAGVDRYPTWFFPGQGKSLGLHEPEELAQKANCPLPVKNE